MTDEEQVSLSLSSSVEQTEVTPSKIKHSRAGIASFVISIAFPIYFLFFQSTNAFGLDFGKYLFELFLLPLLILFTGLVLGIKGVVKKNERKTFAIIGLILCLAELSSIIIAMFILGFFARSVVV